MERAGNPLMHDAFNIMPLVWTLLCNVTLTYIIILKPTAMMCCQILTVQSVANMMSRP